MARNVIYGTCRAPLLSRGSYNRLVAAPQLNLLRSPVQAAFSNAPDLPWTGERATVRAVGEGAGDLTYIFMEDSGHMV